MSIFGWHVAAFGGVGVMRWPEAAGLFTPADNPSKGEWFTRDPAAIAATMQKQGTAAGSLPRHGEETDDDAVADLETSLDAAAAARESKELREVERAMKSRNR